MSKYYSIAIDGPSGAGKSTLSSVLAGKPQYTVTEGTIEYMGKDLLSMSPEERSWAGIFMSFQYPVEIPGVSITNFPDGDARSCTLNS